MQLLRGFKDFSPFRGGYASIGNFDGVHRGHQSMLNALTSRSRSEGVPAVAVTFDPHPIALLRPEATPPPLTSIEDRADLLGRYGVDVALVLPTDRSLLSLTAEEFFERIVKGELAARGLVEGPNFFFGRNRSGNITVLRSLCAANGLAFDVVPPMTVDEQLVSSSVIRSLIESGDLGHAVRLLGHPYRVRGVVGRGAERGRQLGFPTANLFEVKTLIPAHGVYAATVNLSDGRYLVAVHVGPNPTFGEFSRKIEAHILDFSGDLYGQELTLNFLARVRDVVRFASIDELKTQLQHDIAQVRSISSY